MAKPVPVFGPQHSVERRVPLTKKVNSISAKIDYCYDMLHGKVPLNPRWLVREVFSNHPNWNLKCGVGVEYVTISSAPDHIFTKCFYIHRSDGTYTDIGIKASLTPPNPVQKIAMACRTAVEPSIDAFRKTIKYGKQKCEISNITLTKSNSHIDHYEPQFNQIVLDWIVSNGLDYDDIMKMATKTINKTEDNNSLTYFVNRGIADNFREYHDSVASLRCILAEENMKRTQHQVLTTYFKELEESR